MARKSRKIRLPDGGMVRISVALKEGDSDNPDKAVFVFHGASRRLLKAVFDRLQKVMMESYDIQRVQIPDMVNGRCPDQWEVTVVKPDFILAAPREWMRLMGVMMNRCVRCELTICSSYEQFLNL